MIKKNRIPRPKSLGAFVFAVLVWTDLPGAALAQCAYYFSWTCPGCGRIGGATSGREGPYPSLDACNAARSRVDVTVTPGACQPQGVCQAPVTPVPTVDPNTESSRLEELERQRLERQRAEEEHKFQQEKNEALEQLKRMAGPPRTKIPELKSPDPAGSVDRPKLKPVPQTAPTDVVDAAQARVDAADPKWVGEMQEAGFAAINSRRSEIAEKTRSFRMKEPPPPELPLRLGQARAGDIILVGPDDSTLSGAAQGFVQGFGEKWLFGNQNTKVTHALVYLGEQSGRKLFLDNQLGEGPRVISETEFRQRYGGRPLYAAQPTLQPDGHELFKAAFDFAKSNMEATGRGHGLGGTRYGIFGKDDVVCSEAALFALARAQAPGRRITVEAVGGRRLLNPIAVTPGDIYAQDGKGYFTVRPMEIDG